MAWATGWTIRHDAFARTYAEAGGEFIRARLRLTAWYAGLLIIVLGAVGVPAVVLVTERLDDQVDSALGDEVVAAAPLLGQIVDAGGSPLPVVQAAVTGAAVSEEVEEEPEEDEQEEEGALRELAEHGQVPTHQLLLDLEGGLLGSTITIVTPPLVAPIAVAAVEGADLRTIDVDGGTDPRSHGAGRAGRRGDWLRAGPSIPWSRGDDTASALAQIFLIAGASARR